ncbi:hypothetical protein SAMN02745823_02244 [Sporobacter termitidis DSM 10068]|uniref:Uncharacterized protein n=1 Tax=Sporobacter termitidis DSM 10068 TaxID=1123282 RepID=A0A1M5Y5C1_9FIRM|nr:hypothetical protein [Sporobacter termitidis]SHI07270.1 hypothetical protein SAMN02745823_02244 [Sporobacter termitidis DSM 10068]
MENRTDFNIAELVRALDSAVLSGDVDGADEFAAALYRLRGGTEEDAVMPDQFPINIALGNTAYSGGHPMKQKSVKKIVALAAAAALIAALGITALATHLFGLNDLVMKNNDTGGSISNPYAGPASPDDGTSPLPQDLIALQGYPGSKEYKATQEWSAFLTGYDTDHAVLNQVGNSANEYTEKYPLYLVYSKDMADKLEEIIAKYGLKLHTEMTVFDTPEQLLTNAGAAGLLKDNNGTGVNKILSGYVYEDGAFQYDGEAVLTTGKIVQYQFGNYVKGTFSDVYLNVGDASKYQEWQYATQSGATVSLALGENKALVILDLPESFVVINVLGGTMEDAAFAMDPIAKADLEKFADLFDYSRLK